MQLKSANILGVRVDSITMADALARIQEFVDQKTPHLVVTADSSGTVIAQDDPEMMQIINTADLVTPDSIGMIWAAKRQGVVIPERVSGVELVDRLCDIGAQKGQRFYFLGAAPGVAQAAAESLARKYPGLQVVGTRDGFFTAEQEPQIVQEIADLKPDYLFVALGIPKQEKFLNKYRNELSVPVMMGVGGSFDVHSGKVKRAPALFRKFNIEWLWRLLSNPKKISKVATLPVFVMLVLTRGKKQS